MAEEKKTSIFERLNKLSASKKKKKDKYDYVSWATAWSDVKNIYPQAHYEVKEMIMDELGNTRPWFDDGKTGWVEVTVTIPNGNEIETATAILAIKNYSNSPIPKEKITSVDANYSIQRCKVKALADCGYCLYIYEGEDLPNEVKEMTALHIEIADLVKKKTSISESAKKKVAELCKQAEREFMPDADESEINGNPTRITDNDILRKLKRQLQAIRAVPAKKSKED